MTDIGDKGVRFGKHFLPLASSSVGDKVINLRYKNKNYLFSGNASVGDKVKVISYKGKNILINNGNIPNWYKTASDLFPTSFFGVSAEYYNNYFWMIGGIYNNPYGEPNVVYKSPDGANWSLVTDSANFGSHDYIETTIFDDKLWCFGENVSYSTDGITWTQTAESPLGLGCSVIVFDDKMWIIGGYYNYDRSSRVYSSADGITWDLETTNPGWSPRAHHRCLTYRGNIWLTGGSVLNKTYTSPEVWVSDNGVDWSLITDSPGWGRRVLHGFVEYKNKMYLVGGITQSAPYRIVENDLWFSIDGETWTETDPVTKYTVGYGFGACSNSKRILLCAGITNNGVWAYY